MTSSYARRAASFEQDLLWSVLDQDAVPNILEMARFRWGIGTETAWVELCKQAALGRLHAYIDAGSITPVDLVQLGLEDSAENHFLFVEPTEETQRRLNVLAARG